MLLLLLINCLAWTRFVLWNLLKGAAPRRLRALGEGGSNISTLNDRRIDLLFRNILFRPQKYCTIYFSFVSIWNHQEILF